MMKCWLAPLAIIILLSSVVLANANIEIAGKDVSYKRVITDYINENSIKFFESKGCMIKHLLKRSASFECPENVVSELNVRESRIFHIMDLDTDKQIGADKIWAEGITGSGVRVAVLDTGIDTDHPELQDSYLGGYDYVNNDPYPEDDHGHGTHVAGIITANGASGANSKGVSPDVGIYMYKVCNANGACYEDDMIAAMEAAVGTDAKIMSISIGGGSYTTENCDSDSLAAKVNWVVSQGLTVVVAAGNDGKGVSSPGCASGAIAIGAVDKSSNVPYWSGRGKALDIVAPGVDIYSTLIGGYGKMSGTSMATPHVSGVAALLLDTNSGLTTSEIKTALYSTANPVNKCYKCRLWLGTYCFRQAETTCTPEITGAGVVDAYEAYLAVKLPEQGCSSNADCDDGLYCNGAETCHTGVCQAGTPVDCSGLGDQCNDGVCDEAADSCTTQPKPDGTSCNNGLYCNVVETCQAGVCTGGYANNCSDGNDCTADSCDEAADSCVHTPVADGTSCNDGQFCTMNDVCIAGTCGGTARECSDGIVCTADSCNEVNDACVNTPNNSYCDDGLFCNGAETCSAVSGCQAGTLVVCNDGKVCTADSCNENTDICQYIWPVCGLADGCCGEGCSGTQGNPNYDPDCAVVVKCWNAQYQYLYLNSNQVRKFCKCAQGSYGYKSYSYNYQRATVYSYVDSGNNQNWGVSSRTSYYPVYRVTCTDGKAYQTNQNYYR